MKKLLLILFTLFTLQLSATTYYIATDGSDAGAGTIGDPWATFAKLNGNLSAGDTAYIRGGTYTTFAAQVYQCRWNALEGTVNDTIKIWNYPGETVVWTFTGNNFGTSTRYLIQMNQCNYVWVKGIRLTAAAQPGSSPIIAWNIANSNNIIIENCTVDHIGGVGFKIADEGWGTSDNNVELTYNILYKNCDAYANDDPTSPTPYNGADGFGINHNDNDDPARNNWAKDITYQYCRSWFNSDDGFDFYGCDSTGIVIDGCWAFFNGKSSTDTSNTGNGQGYKLGPNHIDKHLEHQFTVYNSLAVKNRSNGFDQNTLEYSSIHKFYNNFAYFNGSVGFMFGYDQYHGVVEAEHVFHNNIGYLNTGNNREFDDGIISTHNTWDGGVTVMAADFVSLTYTQLFAARQADGSLPVITFGHLAEGSDLIGAGIGVGLTLDGDGNVWNATPSMGAFEYDSDPPDPPGLSEVTTTEITIYNVRYATGGGNVTSDGGGTITSRGVCWSISANPTTADSKFTSGGTIGAFSGRIYPLKANTTYHYRSFAVNESGTSYGADQTFTTPVQSVNTTGGKYLYHNGKLIISK